MRVYGVISDTDEYIYCCLGNFTVQTVKVINAIVGVCAQTGLRVPNLFGMDIISHLEIKTDNYVNYSIGYQNNEFHMTDNYNEYKAKMVSLNLSFSDLQDIKVLPHSTIDEVKYLKANYNLDNATFVNYIKYIN